MSTLRLRELHKATHSFHNIHVMNMPKPTVYIKRKLKRGDNNVIPFQKMVYTIPYAASSMAPTESKQTSLRISFEPFYRVILRYNDWNDDKEAAKTLCRCVSIIDFSKGMYIVRTAKAKGTAIVVTVTHEEARQYKSRILQNGMDAFIEEA